MDCAMGTANMSGKQGVASWHSTRLVTPANAITAYAAASHCSV